MLTTHTPTEHTRRGLRAALTASTVVALTASLTVAIAPAVAAPANDGDDSVYRGGIEVVRTPADAPDTPLLHGTVFVDTDRDGASEGETGLAGVVVTNGRDVVRTDDRGRYELPAFDNMTVSITQPSGYQVPLDEHNVPQFL